MIARIVMRQFYGRMGGEGDSKQWQGVEVSLLSFAIIASQEVISCGSFYSFRHHSWCASNFERESLNRKSNWIEKYGVRCVFRLSFHFFFLSLCSSMSTFREFSSLLLRPDIPFITCGDRFAWLCHSFSEEHFPLKLVGLSRAKIVKSTETNRKRKKKNVINLFLIVRNHSGEATLC